MKLARVVLAAMALALVAGCEVHERTMAVDPHHDWWAQHHGQEAYDRDRAEHEHREWCERTPDRSCEGWR